MGAREGGPIGHDPSARSRVADVVATELASAGVTWVAGHPGGEVVTLIDALEAAGIRFVLTHHETTAAFMAAGHGELTGRPGVALATLGPGATNMLTGVANALLDRAPMLAITGALATDGSPGKTHQDLDLVALYRPVTKTSILLGTGNARQIVRTAIDTSTAWPMGPVHLALPSNVAATGVIEAMPGGAWQPLMRQSATVMASKSDIQRALKMLGSAKRPAVVCGLGVLRVDVGQQVAAIARTIGAVVAVTPKAKGVFNENDPRFVGVLEMAGNDVVVDFLQAADVLLVVGLDIVELDKAWRLQSPAISVDIASDKGDFLQPEVQLGGDMAETLNTLAASLERSDGWSRDDIEEHRRALNHYLRPPSIGLTRWETIDRVWDWCKGNAIVTTDTGVHKFLVGQLWRAAQPRTFFVSNGLSSMGYAIPTAAAASMLKSDSQVIAFVGDGGITMFLGELETLTRLESNLLVIVFVDDSLELIRRSQAERGLTEVGTTFVNPDFGRIAEAYGVSGEVVDDAAGLKRALEETDEPGVRLIASLVNRQDDRL